MQPDPPQWSPFGASASGLGPREVVRALVELSRGSRSLEQLPRFAAQLLGAGSAHAALIADGVQVVVGGVGASEALVGVETAAEGSFCSVTVAEGETTAIGDAALDSRVAHLEQVTSGRVRSYLGVPLRVGDVVVGALCVYDAEPRAWTEADRALLERLAVPVTSELELTATAAQHDSERVLWQLAVDAAGVGAFDWNLETDELRWDERLLEVFGLDRDRFGGTIQAFNAAVHPEDRAMVADALKHAIDTCGAYAAEYRIVRPDGGLRWVGARGRALAGPDGVAVRVLGAAYDITAAAEGEASVRRVLEAMPSAFFHLDPEWRFAYANTEAVHLLSAVSSELIGANIWELFPEAVGSDFERHYRGAAESGRPVEFEAYYPPPLDRWYEVRAWPSPDGLSVYFLDATERRRAQEVLRAGRERAELLGQVTDALTGTLQPQAAAARLSRVVVGPLADWSVVTLLDHPTTPQEQVGTDWRRGLHDVAGWHADADRRALVQRYQQLRLDALHEESLLEQALAGGDPVVVREGATPALEAILAPGEVHEVITRLAPGAVAVVPLRARGRTLGLLSVFRDAGRGTFTDSDTELLTEVAARAGLALDNARLYARQHELAEALQRSLLSEPPTTSFLDLAVRYTPAAETAQVGGDWYDAFLDPSGSVLVAIGDVSGHDTEAAAVMGQLRGLLRGVAVTTGAGPAEVLARVDSAVEVLQLETTATAVVARFGAPEPGAGVPLTWSNAGHPPPFLVIPGPDGPTVRRLQTTNQLLLGVDASRPREEGRTEVPPGGVLLLYTDGLVERRHEPIDEGLDRLEALLTRLATEGVTLDELCDRVLAGLLPPAPEDDVALVAVRVRG